MDPDPDPAAHQTDANQRPLLCRPPRLHFEPLQLLIFDLDSDPNPAFGFDVDPDPDFHSYLDSQNDGESMLIRIRNTSRFLLNILL